MAFPPHFIVFRIEFWRFSSFSSQLVRDFSSRWHTVNSRSIVVLHDWSFMTISKGYICHQHYSAQRKFIFSVFTINLSFSITFAGNTLVSFFSFRSCILILWVSNCVGGSFNNFNRHWSIFCRFMLTSSKHCWELGSNDINSNPSARRMENKKKNTNKNFLEVTE